MNSYNFSKRTIAFIMLGSLLFTCSKKDLVVRADNESTAIEKRFFADNRTADLTESKLVAFLVKQNQRNRFVEKTVAQIGYPRWDKMISLKQKGSGTGRGAADSSFTTYYIPFVRDSQQFVNASMIINAYPSDTSFSYRCDWEYAQRQNNPNSLSDSAEYHAIFFMVLDKAVFGYDEFTIIDTSIFRHNNFTPLRVKLNNPASGNRGNDYTTVQICQDVIATWQDCPYPRGQCGGPNGTCDNCDECTDSGPLTYCWTTFVAGGSGSGSTGGTGAGTSVGSGGGGNTGGGSPPPCPGTTSSQRGQTATYGCGPGWSGGGTPPSTDPCITAQPAISNVNALTQSNSFSQAAMNIHSANPALEHSVTFGKDATGNITASPMITGGPTTSTVDTNWPNAFADVHNHPSNSEPSEGDLYMIIGLSRSRPGWNTRIVHNKNGEVYALVVVDTAAAWRFRSNSYTTDSVYGPVLNTDIRDTIQEVSFYFRGQGETRLYSNERALAYMLDKYNAGVILLKKEGAAFRRLRTSTGSQNNTYIPNDCN